MLNLCSDEYDLPDDVIYFDTAGRSVLPKTVMEVGVSAIKEKAAPWNGVGSDADVQELRARFSELLHCKSECIALCPSTGFAMTMMANNAVRSKVLGPDKRVLILEKEMGSVVYPWRHACELTGASLVFVPDPGVASGSWADQVLSLMDNSVAVVAIPCAHWCDGSFVDIASISLAIQNMDAKHRPLLMIDATQSAGAMDLDLSAVRVDFLACSVQKWLNGPYGMSLVYVHPSHHDAWLPLDQHERGKQGSECPEWDEAEDLCCGYSDQFFSDCARRFDSGGKPNPVLVPMLSAALCLTLKWGPARIHAYLTTLTDALVDGLVATLGATVVVHRPRNQRAGHFVGLRFATVEQLLGCNRHYSSHGCNSGGAEGNGGGHDLGGCKQRGADNVLPLGVDLCELKSRLRSEFGVHSSVRGGFWRVSPYIFTTMSDVEKLVSATTQIVQDMYRAALAACSVTSLIAQSCEPPTASCALMHALQQPPLRVLVVGAAGWLGQFLYRALLRRGAGRLELYAGYHSALPTWSVHSRRVKIDLTEAQSTRLAIQQVLPHVVLHVAAISSPAVCHNDQRLAQKANCPTHLVDAVQELCPNSLFVFASTDMVYDGMHPPYAVSSLPDNSHSDGCVESRAADASQPRSPRPVNAYGRTKLQMESQVCRLKHAVVMRLSNMIGPAYVYRHAGTKFLQFLESNRKRREAIGLRAEEVRSFVYVGDVVDIVWTSILRHMRQEGRFPAIDATTEESITTASTATAPEEADCPKLYNVGGPRALSRLQLALELCRATGQNVEVHENAALNNVLEKHMFSSAAIHDQRTHGGSASSHMEHSIWQVYPTPHFSSSTSTTAPPVAEPASMEEFSELCSPLDIFMDSTQTEKHFGMRFTDLAVVLADIATTTQ